MATKLYGTSIALPAPFVAGSCDPVDARLIVETFTDLTTNAGDTFGVISDTYCKVYEGLTVYVSDEKATYMYVGGYDANGILLTDVQNPSNWRKTSDSSTSSTEVASKLEEIEEKITQVSVVNTDGSISVSAATSTGTPIGVKIRSTDNALKLDPSTGLYVDSNEIPQYTGSGAIAITGSNPNKVVSLTIDGTDQVLTQTVSGIKTNLTLNWSSGTGLQLVGKDSQVLATVPAADFIKDGMLQNVELKTASAEEPVGEAQSGTFLVFTFNTDAGSNVINLDVTSLIDVYTAGNGIEVTGKVISVKRDGSSETFLTIGADGIKLSGVQDAINTAQQTVQNAIDKVESSVGLGTDGTFTAPVSATYVNDATSVMDAITQLDTQAKANADAIDAVRDAAISVVAGNGISVTGSGTAKTITAVAKPSDPMIEVSAEGIGLKDDAVFDCGTY